jgi:hypothetical protein
MSGRGPVIAGQVAIVAVLIAIVYGSFLRPDDAITPSGIDAGNRNAQNLETGGGGGDGGGAGTGSAGGAAGGTEGTAGGGAGGAGGTGGAGAGGGASGAGTGGGDTLASAIDRPGNTPVGNQYSDTLTSLKHELGISAEGSPDRRKRR